MDHGARRHRPAGRARTRRRCGALAGRRPGGRRPASGRRRRRRSTRRHQGRLPAAAKQIRTWVNAEPGWLPADPGVTREPVAGRTYYIAADPVPRLPVRHLPAARSRRHVEQPQRQPARHPLFSAAGKYNAHGASPHDSVDGDRQQGRATPTTAGDIPVRAAAAHPATVRPRAARRPRPAAAGGEPGFAWPDFQRSASRRTPSFGVGRDLPRPVHLAQPRGAGRPGVAGRPLRRARRYRAKPASDSRAFCAPPGLTSAT